MFAYQQIQLYRQRLCVVVQAVGMSRAAVGLIVICHDGAGVTAVQPTGYWLALKVKAALPLAVGTPLPMDSAPVEHSKKRDHHHQQGQHAHQNCRHQIVVGLQWIWSWIHSWGEKMKNMKKV